MRKPAFLLSLILMILPAGVQAFTVDDLRTAVDADDMKAVEAGLDRAQTEYLEGARSADDIRDLFIAISRSDPAMISFVEDWFNASPTNPKAQIARAWSLWNGANQIAKAENDYARQVVAAIKADFTELALAAYASDPDLMPAADALIRGYAQDMSAPTPLEVMNNVLARDPNWGSVERALHELRATSVPMQRNFCTSVSAAFSKRDAGMIRHRCMMRLALMFGHPAMLDYAYAHLWDDSDPYLTGTRVAHFVTWTNFTRWTPEQIDWAERLLLTHPVNQFELVYLAYIADVFQNKVRHAHGLVLGREHLVHFTQTFRQQRLTLAQEYLAHDPLNLGLIDLVDGVAHAPPMELTIGEDGNVTYRPDRKALSDQERRAQRKASDTERAYFIQQRLIASPYYPQHWQDYARSLSRSNMPRSLFDDRAARENAIALSTDPAQALKHYIALLESNFKRIQEIEAMSEQDLAQLPDWQALYTETNLPDKLLCP